MTEATTTLVFGDGISAVKVRGALDGVATEIGEALSVSGLCFMRTPDGDRLAVNPHRLAYMRADA